jgi:hypothetical protein
MVVCAAAPAMVALSWAVARSDHSPLAQDAAARPVVVAAGEAVRDDAAQVTIKVIPAAPREAKAVGAGLVTSVLAKAGRRLQTGDVVVTVDDRPWMAYLASAPLWRDLSPGMRGADVARAQAFLEAMGLRAGSVRGTVTAQTAAAFRALNERLGLGTADHTLHTSALVWVGPDPLTVGELKVRPGDSVGPGAVLLLGPMDPARIEVEEPPDVVTSSDEPRVLAVGGATVGYTPGSGAVTSAKDVTVVIRALAGRAEGAGAVRLATPERVATLPASAIVTDAQGRLCVFERVSGPPVPVMPIGSGTLSVVDVPAEWAGRSVLANPRDVRSDLSCG